MPVSKSFARIVLLMAVMGLSACAGTAPSRTLSASDRAALTAAVQSRLQAEREQELSDLSVVTEADGTVVLGGRTYTQAKADRAVQIARETPGVSRVRNTITSLPSNPR
jgi:osmotically-inducible protein OsmY